MEFGRVNENELKKIDFSLPPDPAMNKLVLKGKPLKRPHIYVGCAKWGRQEWVGKIYPAKTKEKDFLEHYVKHYNSIELNATHYKIYGETGIAKWAEKAKGRDFLFCPKMYQGVTHRGALNGKDFISNEFFRGIMAFGKHLGPIFIQVSDTFSPKRKTELFSYLESLPKDLSFFLEVRHPDWFTKESEELFGFLHKQKIGAVITDTAGRRDCAHMHLTIPKTFIRFVGNSLHPSDYPRIDAWVKRIKKWLDNGMKKVYFFMHMHDEATSPELTVYLAEKLEKVGITIPQPQFVAGQQSLF
ncbi:MAG: hypothetical protein ABS85_07110 [Sphingobacteriales bacterium SCN 48-20]|uniref:DUF72 domain-containing protein n=1 Tax=Terrimonas ferruginea TaxID=249 RepID=UPI000869AA29|nr:DUF72 domain-containing protein [Terrimonas ferruginea]MBN8782387.1 DUF72 domain-containing protein [Terrimonas ferruginea]ODT93031.1 MAG: hypothetical protein ABS85_07110 [Sphingobacteriales bacterium SCN 48-20]OJW42901.1 MAG: hypothetical protein BGO56_12785 [Sphingobacteriales bacterium 48-107]